MSTIRTARTRTTRLVAAASAFLLAATLAAPALASDHGGHAANRHGQALGRLAPGIGAELAQVRAATAKYHDVEVALADGFEPPENDHCVEGPDGAGAMGYHYVHFGRVGQLDPTLPQVLLYAPGHDDQLRLVGVEYLHPSGGEVFGQPLTPSPAGPALHVWLWQANPAGMFAPFNAHVSCQ